MISGNLLAIFLQSAVPNALTGASWIPLGAAVLTLLGVLITNALTWWKDGNRDAKRLRIWEESKKAVDFWDARLKVLTSALPSNDKQLSDAKAETLAEIELIRVRLKKALATESPSYSKPTVGPRISVFRSAFLLYPKQDFGTSFSEFRLLRYFYWLVVSVSFLVFVSQLYLMWGFYIRHGFAVLTFLLSYKYWVLVLGPSLILLTMAFYIRVGANEIYRRMLSQKNL